MDAGLRSGLLLFALLTLFCTVPIALRRGRPPLLAAVHGLGLVVVVALIACAALGRGDARPLLLPYLVGLTLAATCAAGPSGRRPVPRGLSRSGLVLGLLGVAATGVTLTSLALPLVVPLGFALLATAFASAAAWRSFSLARAPASAAERRADVAAGLASLVAGGAVVVALVAPDGPLASSWALLLALAACLTTAARVPPFVPPTAREGVSALFVALALSFAALAEGALGPALLVGLEGGLVTLAVLAASRALLLPRSRAPARATGALEAPGGSPQLLAEAALAHMSPMLDDGLMLRPGRPRVNARVTAKRLFEASLERARAAGPPGRRSLAVDVREEDADADVEGDPAELAEALCAVLDNALRLKQQHPALALRVHVRGSPSHVTFEVEDDLAEKPAGAIVGPPSFAPFQGHEGDPPGLGVGLARAKLLVERHGGVLLARRTQGGSCVQLTVPRRRGKHLFGLA